MKNGAFQGLTMMAVGTFQEACEKFGLDFKVEKRPLYFPFMAEGKKVPEYVLSPFHCQVVRDSKIPLGLVGSRYVLTTFPEAFSPSEALMEAGARVIGGGTGGGGARGYLILEADGAINLGPKDDIINRFMLTSSHDGTGKIEVRMTPFRPRTGTALTIDTTHPLSFKHTRNVKGKVLKAKQTFARVNSSWQEFSSAVQKMISRPLSTQEAKDFITAVLPSDTDSARMENIRDDIFLTYTTTGIGNNLPSCKGTLFGLVQAFAEWADLKRSVRKSNKKDERSAGLDARLMADGARKKQNAYAMALYLINNNKLKK